MIITLDQTYERRRRGDHAGKFARVTEVLSVAVSYELTTEEGEYCGAGCMTKQTFALTFGPLKTAAKVTA